MLRTMKSQKKGDAESLLYSYYTLAHSTSQQRDSPSPPSAKTDKKHEVESGDETDRSFEPDNEIHESFFMDEINLNTESCSLNSSRENLLDGDPKQGGNREGRSGSRPTSRPSSARRTSLKTAELPVDERIKVLEEGLKEADIEREVVLSCLGKEYLERVTMQNYLQEICSKSGYNYEEIKAKMEVQSGAQNILDSMIDMRTKALFEKKNKAVNAEELVSGDGSEKDSETSSEKGNVTVKENQSDKESNVLDTMTEGKLRDVIAKAIQAEQEKLNTKANGDDEREGNSHTQPTKRPSITHVPTAGANNSAENITVGGNNKNEALETNKSTANEIIVNRQLDDRLMSADSTSKGHEKNTASQIDEKTADSLCAKSQQSDNLIALELKYKQSLLGSANMPARSNEKQSGVDTSILHGLDKVKTFESKSLDSIDEGIFMLKSFLTDLLAKNQRVPGRMNREKLDSKQRPGSFGPNVAVATDNTAGQVKARRKLSLNDFGNSNVKSDFKPQRRRSFAEGMDNIKPKIAESKTIESRLFKATVASQNKMKGRITRREAESDTESAKKMTEGRNGKPKKRSFSRSATDVRDYSTRSAYTSTEEDSSIDGDEDYRPALGLSGDSPKTFKYVYEMDQGLTNREYSKLFSILNMLQDQKRKWEDEARMLKVKIADLKNSNSDLSHDNSVLRKSLEAANHAIKEINAKVQELKLTIVPLRDENSKLRDQNHSLKSKLDLLRKDKAGLLQEFQELKKTKLKYEEKLQLVTDLYQNGRINLATDQNNNHPTEAAGRFSKGGLKALLDVNDEEKTKEQSRLSRSRIQDKSKRHSFHGFEKIEELAGNAEELVAEKEKFEEENSKLKQELKELKEQFVAKNEKDNMTDEEILNRRKGWKMQREESKHRIIREILKTESSPAMFGRPYSSCGDLTMADKPEYASRSLWGAGKQKKRPQENTKSTAAERMSELRRPKQVEVIATDDDYKNDREKGYISFEVNWKNEQKNKNEISWKEESKKISERLANFKFVKVSQVNKADSKISVENGSEDINGGSKERVVHSAANDDEDGFENLQDRDATRPSQQWPIVKEKIQALYGLPVEFTKKLQDDDYDDEDGQQEKTVQNGRNKQRSSRDGSETSQYSKYEQKTTMKQETSRNEMARSNATRKSVQEMVVKHVLQAEEDDSMKNRELQQDDWSRMDSEWQRKSSDGENDFETYQEITKQRQQAKNRLRHSSRSRASVTKTAEYQTSNETKSVLSENDQANGRKVGLNGGEPTSGFADSRSGSSWVEVPVYLKKNEKEKKSAKKNNKTNHKEKHFQSEKTKAVEETITKVESAFSASGKKLTKKQDKSGKNKYMKDGKEFVRSSATVMYLDELSASDSDSNGFERPKTLPRRSKSFRRPRPKSDYWSSEKITENGSSQHNSSFQRNRSLRLPNKTRDDMFAVDITIDAESEYKSSNSPSQFDSPSQSFESKSCQHHNQHHHGNHSIESHARHRIHSETGTRNTRQSKRPKSPGSFSCEMCRELNKKKIAQEKYCWEKYFPIGETTIDAHAMGFKEDYV